MARRRFRFKTAHMVLHNCRAAQPPAKSGKVWTIMIIFAQSNMEQYRYNARSNELMRTQGRKQFIPRMQTERRHSKGTPGGESSWTFLLISESASKFCAWLLSILRSSFAVSAARKRHSVHKSSALLPFAVAVLVALLCTLMIIGIGAAAAPAVDDRFKTSVLSAMQLATRFLNCTNWVKTANAATNSLLAFAIQERCPSRGRRTRSVHPSATVLVKVRQRRSPNLACDD